jgi:hypothetical protein
MKQENVNRLDLNRHLGCFGSFENEDPICKKMCAINLRCIIERDQNMRMEILEDLVASNDILIKMQ